MLSSVTVPIAPWLEMAAVLVALGGALAALRAVQVRFRPHPEAIRKALHVTMGGVTLTFPWLFEAAWPVVVLAVLATTAMAALRFAPPLRRAFGPVLHAVERLSIGELCFAPAVAVVFVLAGGDPVRYGLPVLLLACADPVAALAGQRWGCTRYRTPDGEKSLEGSAACFLTACACTHVPLLLFTATGRLESLLLAVLVAAAVALLEAAAWRGLDNLFIPLGGWAVLHVGLPMNAPTLAGAVAVVGTLAGVGVWWLLGGPQTTGGRPQESVSLTSSTAAGAALVGLAAWWIGGGAMLLPPAVLCFGAARATEAACETRLVLAVVLAGLCGATFALAAGAPAWTYFYALAGLAAGALGLVQTAEGGQRQLTMLAS